MTELVDKGIDASETDVAVSRRRRNRRLLGSAAVVALVGAGAVAVWQPWGGDASDSSSSTTDAKPANTLAEEADLPYLVIGELPEGYVPQWVNDPALNGNPIDSSAGAAEQELLLFIAPGGTYAKGKWLSVSAQLLDRFERRKFQPSNYLDMSTAKQVTIGDYAGVISTNSWDGSTTLLFGVVNDGFAVALNAVGFTDAELERIAREITLDEHDTSATPIVGPAVSDLGLQPTASITQMVYGFSVGGPPIALGSQTGRTVGWGILNQAESVTLMIDHMPTGMEFDQLAHFMLDKAQDVKVGDAPAVAGVPPANFGPASMVMWQVDGAFVSLTSTMKIDDLVKVAQSVRPSDLDEWTKLRDATNNFNPGMSQPQEAWIIGSGDLSDSTTWIVEGSYDADTHALTPCASSLTPNSGMSSGCMAAIDTNTLPVLEKVGGVAINGSGAAYLALVSADAVGMVLRFTPDAGDSVEIVPHAIRDWPFLAGVVTPESPGTVELIDADGKVLASEKVAEGDLNSGPGDAPATTVVAFG